MSKIWMVLLLTISGHFAFAQTIIKIKVTDSATHELLTSVSLKVNNKMAGITDTSGNGTIAITGESKLELSSTGYRTKTITLHTSDMQLNIELAADNTSLEEVVLVATTRNNQDIESSPLKVEVLGKEEVSEEVGIRPGNIASILGDVSGVQIQQSSPSTGNSNVRIQGLQGRYTQTLRDGMPLYDGFSGGLGILTIPPLDLRQIELIKGSASTLYGGGSITGLINLLSKKPGFEQEADVLANYTTLKELNLNAYIARRWKKTGYTLFAGYNHQDAVDVNKDGFSDVPNTNTFIFHPKLFLYPSGKTIISIGYSGTFDKREGGDMRVLGGNGDSVHRYYEGSNSNRHTLEYTADHFYSNNARLIVKGIYSYLYRDLYSSYEKASPTQQSYYDEVSLYRPYTHSELVTGINIVGDNYTVPARDTVLIHVFSNFTAGIFGQYTLHIKERTTLEGGVRIDHHNNYGFFVPLRVALFHHINEYFGIRAGVGTGYKTPNPLAPQDIDISLRDIAPVRADVVAEHSYGANLEGNFKKEWDKKHSIFINQAFFLTHVSAPTYLAVINNDMSLVNVGRPLVTTGFDTYIKLALNGWEIYGGYTFTNAKNGWRGSSYVPLTPQHRMAFVIAKEIEEQWRVGLEGSYTGRQYYYDIFSPILGYNDMQTSRTPGYVFLALMVQRNLGKHISVVLNCENLLDYRMSREGPLYIGTVSAPAFLPLWAPIDGRVVNLSLRWKR